MTRSRPTLDQRRACHAWSAIEDAGKLKGTAKADYGREAKRLPMRIRTSGLGQATTFLKAKADSNDANDHRSLLLRDLDDWLLNERGLGAVTRDARSGGVIGLVVNGDARLVRRATEEALLYLQWLSRFAEAEFGIDDE